MRSAFSLALASLFAFLSTTTSQAEPAKIQKPSIAQRDVTPATYALQTASVGASCFPERLRGVLAYIAMRTKHSPLVTSGYRPHASRRGSLHRSCMAADIRMPGVSYHAILAAAADAPGIGGIGTYCNGIVHVDIGPKRRWNFCTSRRHPSPLIASADADGGADAGGLRFKLRRIMPKSAPPITKAAVKYTAMEMSMSKPKVETLVSNDTPEASHGSHR